VSRTEVLRSDLGGKHPRAATKVKSTMDTIIQGFIRNAPFAVMASANGEGDCDASPKGGLPGFIKVLDDATLLIPDIGGNRLFQSYENFESNPKAGLVFIIPGIESTARVNGRIEVLEAAQIAERGIKPEVLNADQNSGMVQGIVLHVDEAYLHCPRSFRFAALWDIETINNNASRSLTSFRDT
jgi:predicted pyridoxine 5'-phosphate oxidase superfamily flavin-nucleotide-binding protein